MPKESAKRKTKETKVKRKKDPNAPKRGLSAYMFFANDKRDLVHKENPGIKFGEVGKLLGEMWKDLTEKDKQPYLAKAKADKERYESEKARYQAGGADDDEDD